MVKVKQDLTGMIFGRLIVIEQGEDHICPNGKRIAQWYCKCNCGNQDLKLIRGSSLTSGSTRSCGCLSKEISSKNGKNLKKYNTYFCVLLLCFVFFYVIINKRIYRKI